MLWPQELINQAKSISILNQTRSKLHKKKTPFFSIYFLIDPLSQQILKPKASLLWSQWQNVTTSEYTTHHSMLEIRTIQTQKRSK